MDKQDVFNVVSQILESFEDSDGVLREVCSDDIKAAVNIALFPGRFPSAQDQEAIDAEAGGDHQARLGLPRP